MAKDEEDRKALGDRLKSARTLVGITQEGVAKALTDGGYPTGKAAVSEWEKGRNIPDALVLRRLAKLYETSADALLWDTALTTEAVHFGAQFDALNDRQQRTFRAMWLAYFAEAKTDEHVENTLLRNATPLEWNGVERRLEANPVQHDRRARVVDDRAAGEAKPVGSRKVAR
jgi:transcriptional regulator with XRE-family HTH domain